MAASAQTPPPGNGNNAPDSDKLETLHTSITVVEKISADTPAPVTVLDRDSILEVPGVNLDDRLRNVPGFSLFRRNSSLVAHPTTQGVSLRGIGSSGASRTLVLWDGVPVNDPFGGWLYWTRFEPEELERVEVSRGASTSVFGDRALGGAIHLFSRPIQHNILRGRYEAGNLNTHDVSAGYSTMFSSQLGLSVNGRGFTTDGYYIVPENLRGSVDRRAGVRFATGNVRLDYMGTRQRVFFKSDVLAEERENGTALQTNSTGLGMVSGHYQGEYGRSIVSVLGFRVQEGFHSTFSTVIAGRNTENLAFTQAVPSNGTGGAGLWNYHGNNFNLLGGADFLRVEGTSTDYLRPSGTRVGGGSQFQRGVFAQADGTWKSLKLFGGLREHFTGNTSFFSPSAGFVAGRGIARVRGSVYRGFRAPTLNELYRVFRQGNAQTNANPDLRPETVFGSEFGFDLAGERTHVGVTFFRNSIEDLVTNVTIPSTPPLILRQRQNAASALGRGAEFTAMRRFFDFTGEVSYLFVDSRYGTGQRVPQVARHQGSAELRYQRRGTLVTLGARSFSYAFDDDLNTLAFRLGGFATMQLVARQQITPRLSALAAFENLLDRQYVTARTPTPNLGAPRLFRIGLRWEGRVR
jgi:outer membrane cobalamin receptor